MENQISPDQASGVSTSAPSPIVPASANGPAASPDPTPAPKANQPPSGSSNRGKTSAATEKKPKSTLESMEQLDQVGKLSWTTLVPSWLVSAVVHALLLVILALIIEPAPIEKVRDLIAYSDRHTDSPEELTPESPPVVIEDAKIEPADVASLADASGAEVTNLVDAAAAPARVEIDDFSLSKTPISDLTKDLGTFSGKGLEGRGEAARRALVLSRGGSDASEEAVAKALAWLAAHQNADGSWSIDHRKGGACQGRCGNPGSLDNCNIAATALGLLPFLGAGQTHQQGKYKQNVRAGLYYLVNRMKVGPNGGDLWEPGGRMYGHGLAAIALCEAYAMTQDKGLAGPAQQSLNFIVYAQDPNGGGWRYTPHEPGDTSVVGWQLMALKSGHMAYLNVPPRTIQGAVNFLNTVQSESGAMYGYLQPEPPGSATTAIGLLCRMYLGWKHDEPSLERGVHYLGNLGPSPTNMYFNYYATQVMHHFGGDPWEKWNDQMRDFLIKSQSKNGHEAGSWWFNEKGHVGEAGGRIYATALAAMTLEVYYRHLPIYQKQSTDDDFVD